MKKVSNNVIKVIAISTVTMLIALTLELLMYYAAADWGAFEVGRPKASVYGMFVQVLAILGIILCIAGIWYGIKQRHYYSIQEINKMGR